MSHVSLDRRQGVNGQVDNSTNTDNSNNDNFYGGWYWSPEAYAIKWAIVAVIFVAFIFLLVGGAWHARRRMRNGLPPLSYHRWLVSRRQRAAFYAAHPNLPESQAFHQHHQQHQFSFYRPGYGDSRAAGHAGVYQMGPYGAPPPAYGQAHEDYVPEYTPPQGPNKVNPDQNYAPPAGAPPQQGTGTLATGSGSGQGQGHAQTHPGGDLGARP